MAHGLTVWKFPVTGKGKAVLKKPSIPLCANDDCAIEIEGIDLLSCNAPGCNLTLCKCTNAIYGYIHLASALSRLSNTFFLHSSSQNQPP